VKAVRPLSQVAAERIAIQNAYLLSCVNARLEDLAEAARILEGRRVGEGVELYVAAASSAVEEEARARGIWQSLLSAGAIPLPPGCGPCIGLGKGTLRPGETGISATNRNYPGRMGDPSAQCYLASPAVVAASAIAGVITGPEMGNGRAPLVMIRESGASPTHSDSGGGEPAWEELVRANQAPQGEGLRVSERGATGPANFPDEITGGIVLLPWNDINTDGIYPAELTYRDGVSPEEMTRAVFGNYDPDFARIARPGDILVAGEDFGIGSSREQAATAIQAFGIPVVIAASFSQTYKRNAFNNGFPVIECAKLVHHLVSKLDPERKMRTIRIGAAATVNLSQGTIRMEDATYCFSPLSLIGRRLLESKGLGNLVKEEIRRSNWQTLSQDLPIA
jgi:homoaconitate hydratase